MIRLLPLLLILLGCEEDRVTEYVCKADGYVYSRTFVIVKPFRALYDLNDKKVSCDENIHPEPRYSLDEWRRMKSW